MSCGEFATNCQRISRRCNATSRAFYSNNKDLLFFLPSSDWRVVRIDTIVNKLLDRWYIDFLLLLLLQCPPRCRSFSLPNLLYIKKEKMQNINDKKSNYDVSFFYQIRQSWWYWWWWWCSPRSLASIAVRAVVRFDSKRREYAQLEPFTLQRFRWYLIFNFSNKKICVHTDGTSSLSCRSSGKGARAVPQTNNNTRNAFDRLQFEEEEKIFYSKSEKSTLIFVTCLRETISLQRASIRPYARHPKRNFVVKPQSRA